MSPAELGERLAALEAQFAALRDTVTQDHRRLGEELRRLRIQLEGPPRDESLRGRLHKLEQAEHAAKAATAALEAAREIRDAAGERRFSRRERVVIVCTAVLGSLLALGTFSLALVAALT